VIRTALRTTEDGCEKEVGDGPKCSGRRGKSLSRSDCGRNLQSGSRGLERRTPILEGGLGNLIFVLLKNKQEVLQINSPKENREDGMGRQTNIVTLETMRWRGKIIVVTDGENKVSQ